jgi:hypothetical protein
MDDVLLFDEASDVVRADVRAPRRASFSCLDTWMACPGRWLAGRVLPVRYEWDSPLVLGSIAHGALQLAAARPETVDPDWLDLCARAVLMLREENRRTGWKPDPIPRGVSKPDGSPMLEVDWVGAAAAKLKGFRLSDVFGVRLRPAVMEQKVDAVVWGVPMTGSVDYRDVERGVVDWKTGRVPDRVESKRRHADQLRVYKALLETADVCGVSQARDVYVEHRTFAVADLSADAMADTGRRMRGAWRELNECVGEGVFPLRPSGLCGWCPLANACPAATLYGGKARAAAARQWDRSDPRFRYVGHGEPFAGFNLSGTHGVGATIESEESHMSLFDTLMAQQAGLEPKPQAADVDPWSVPTPAEKEPTPQAAAPVEDNPTAKAALEKWGVPPAEPEKPVPPAEPEKPVPPAEPEKPVPPAGAVEGVRLMFGKPFEPTVHAENELNANAYGFSASIALSATATLLCGKWLTDRTYDAAMLLVRLEWETARAVFGDNVPDVPGLADGRPERAALGAWLDSTIARDTDRVFMRVMERAGLLEKSDVPVTFDGLEQRLSDVSELTRNVLSDARRIWGA